MKEKSKGFLLATAAATLLASGFTPTLLNADIITLAEDSRQNDGCPNGCPNKNDKEKVRRRDHNVSQLNTDEPCLKEEEEEVTD